MNKKKIFLSIFLFILLMPTIVFASVKEQAKGGYWYLYDDQGNMLTGFQYIPQLNKTCYYDKYGHMLYGQQYINGYWYLFDNVTGAMKTGFQYISNQSKWVYYNSEGHMLYGFQDLSAGRYYFDPVTGAASYGEKAINGHWYLFSDFAVMQTGFQYIANHNKWVYYNSEGHMLYGFQDLSAGRYYFDPVTGAASYGEKAINGHWYLFSDFAVMQTGFQYIANHNKWVYYNSEGHMLYGLQEIDGGKYYFDPITGAMQKGTKIINNKLYCFDNYGKMITSPGEINIDGYWYLIKEDGSVATGFQYLSDGNKTVYYNNLGRMLYGQQKINGYWYLFDKVTGAMQTGFQTIKEESKTVYYNEQGRMLYGYQTIDGVQYYFNTVTGAMKSNFVYKNGKTYYYLENGGMANDWINIAGTKYFFNSLGEMIGKNVQKVVDVSSYQTNVDWYTAKTQGGVDGAILRIAAGCEKEDSQLAYNISQVKKYNIPYGIYIYSYAENYNEGVLYAQFTINMIKKYGMNPTLGIYLDLENNGVTSYMGTTHYTNVVRGYMDTMQAAGYGHLTKIYTYTSYANSALNTEYIRSQIDWIAQYYHYTTYTGPIRMWQYSSTERVAGINGNVDVSVKFY